jgi:hypothetical protein
MPSTVRTAACSVVEGKSRYRTARAYLDVAELVLDERDRDEHLNVAAGLAVLAGIAAADSICCTRLGRLHRGDDHRGAIELLGQAAPDGAELATKLRRLPEIKDAAHYGVQVVATAKARNAVGSARRLVERAQQESER